MKLRSILQKEIKKGMYNIAFDAEAKRLLPFLKRKRRRTKKMSSVSHKRYSIYR